VNYIALTALTQDLFSLLPCIGCVSNQTSNGFSHFRHSLFFNGTKNHVVRIVAHFNHVILQATNDLRVGNLQKTMMLFKANVQPLNHASCFN
jgi:hypothetical protein